MTVRFPSKTKWKIHKFALKAGVSSLLRRNYFIGLKQLVYPVGYWRFPIFPIVVDVVGNTMGKKVLDIGSPKLLSLFLSLEYGHTIYATDLQDPSIFKRYQGHYNDFAFSSNKEGKYIVEFQDARKLNYPNDSFDFVYSVSVLEHIPNDGDKEAMSEIARVLNSHGKAIIEVPFALQGKETYINESIFERRYEGKPIFYQRHYDDISLFTRLINPSKMNFVKKIITVERFPFEKYWDKLPSVVKTPFLWAESLISHFNHYALEEDEKIISRRKRNCAMSATIVLEKC